MTTMGIEIQDLTRGWIRYVKNMGIVKSASDPNTGRLTYLRQPNVQDLRTYLKNTGDFNDEAVRNAIVQVLSKKSGATPGEKDNTSAEPDDQRAVPNGQKALPGKQPGDNVSTWHHTEVTPGQKQEPSSDVAQTRQSQPKKSRFNTDDAEDVEVKSPRQPPPRLQGNGNAPRLNGPAQPEEPPQQPQRKPRFKYRNKIREALYDDDGAEVSEEDVEAIFKLLLSQQVGGSPAKQNEPEQNNQAQSPEGQTQGKQTSVGQNPEERKKFIITKLHQIIENDMIPSQRKALWRALNEA
jgi:hypothetical protein